MGNKDKTRDGDAAADRDHSRANRDHSRDRESRDAALARTIAEAVALQTQSCTIGLMVKAFPKLKDGKTARFSSVRQSMMN